MTEFLVERPGDEGVELFEVFARFFGDVTHDGVNGFRFVIPFFALDDIFGGHPSLGQVDITCVSKMSILSAV